MSQPNALTGFPISSSYHRLVQFRSGSIYDGTGSIITTFRINDILFGSGLSTQSFLNFSSSVAGELSSLGSQIPIITSQSHAQNTDLGTDSFSFYVGGENTPSSIYLHVSQSLLMLRNANDSDYRDLAVRNLYVYGTETIFNTETMEIGDNILELNTNFTGSVPIFNSGLHVNRGTVETMASIIWDEGTDQWKAGLDGSEQAIVLAPQFSALSSSYLSLSSSYVTLSNSAVSLSTFNTFTASYVVASSSFDTRISNSVATTAFHSYTASVDSTFAVYLTTASFLVTSASFHTRIDLKANDNAVVKNTGNQNVAGVKNFLSFPLHPIAMPTNPSESVHKLYVDTELQDKLDITTFESFTSSFSFDTSSLLPRSEFETYTSSVSFDTSSLVNYVTDNFTTQSLFNNLSQSVVDLGFFPSIANSSGTPFIVATGSTTPLRIATIGGYISVGFNNSTKTLLFEVAGLIDFSTFHSYTASVTSALGGKLDVGTFESYTASVTSALGGKLDVGTFESYTASVTSTLGGKLDVGTFESYTASVTFDTSSLLPRSEFESYTASVTFDTSSLLPRSEFEIYTASVTFDTSSLVTLGTFESYTASVTSALNGKVETSVFTNLSSSYLTLSSSYVSLSNSYSPLSSSYLALSSSYQNLSFFPSIANSAGTVQIVATGSTTALRFSGTGATSVSFDNTTKTITISSTDTNTTYTAGTGLTLSSTQFALTGQALALHNLATNGIIARTGASAYSARTITAGTGVSVSNGDGGSGNPTIAIGQEVGTANSVQFSALGVNTAAGSAGTIRATGDITAFYSDQRLKTDIAPIHSALDRLCTIDGVYYRGNSKAGEFGYDDKKRQMGVLAQQVQTVFPEIVELAPFDSSWDEDLGEYISNSGNNYLTVKYEKLIPVLIESIKELKKRIETLEN